MKYGGTLIIVKDIVKARNFYENIMEQKVLMDLGEHISLENGLGLQSNYEAIVGKPLNIKKQSNNFQLYFEVDNIEKWEDKLKKVEDIEFIHDLKEYPWGQRAIRIYDYDKYILEISESMESVAIRYLKQGLSVEETAKRTMFPVEFVEKLQ